MSYDVFPACTGFSRPEGGCAKSFVLLFVTCLYCSSHAQLMALGGLTGAHADLKRQYERQIRVGKLGFSYNLDFPKH